MKPNPIKIATIVPNDDDFDPNNPPLPARIVPGGIGKQNSIQHLYSKSITDPTTQHNAQFDSKLWLTIYGIMTGAMILGSVILCCMRTNPKKTADCFARLFYRSKREFNAKRDLIKPSERELLLSNVHHVGIAFGT
jgi:hypothetical protein